jgi:isopenicillin N synthase-like dioxygenase
MSTCFASTYQASSGRLPSSPTSGFEIPVVDFVRDSPSTAQQIVSHAATTDGLAFVRNLPHQPDFLAIQRLFDNLYQSPQLAARLNSTYEKRGVFKLAGKLTDDPTVDDKATIDLSAHRLQHIQDYQLLQDLGTEFETTVKFFEAVEKQLVPLVLHATASVIGKNVDLHSIHQERNNNFRLIDYHSSASSLRHGCGEHRDYGTATIIFQDGSGGLEFQDPQTDEWHSVPGHETVIVWGWSGHVLSGGKAVAIKHRVKSIGGPRRNTAVWFIAPDLETSLQPLVGNSCGFAERIAQGHVKVGGFKDLMGKTWRWREGTQREGTQASNLDQDRDVFKFLYHN